MLVCKKRRGAYCKTSFCAMVLSPFLECFYNLVSKQLLPYSKIGSLKSSETKRLKILIIDNVSPCHLVLMKLCTVIELENI